MSYKYVSESERSEDYMAMVLWLFAILGLRTLSSVG